MAKQQGPVWEKENAARQSAAARARNAYLAAHRTDSDAQLLDSLRACAQELGRNPTKADFPGAALLKERFGPWRRALEAAGLLAPVPAEDAKRQRNRLRCRSEAQVRQARKERKTTAEQSRPARRRRELEQEFAESHSGDTDRQLLECVRQQAAALGRTPSSADVVGSEYIKSRMGEWFSVLDQAGLAYAPPQYGKRAARRQMTEAQRREEQRQLARRMNQKAAAPDKGPDRD